jgi:hypothetical protein
MGLYKLNYVHYNSDPRHLLKQDRVIGVLKALY